MRIFVTGATGFVGSAVVAELLAAGHQVLGLARNDQGADAVAKAGAQVHRGSLEDPASLRRAVAGVDGVIHTAFIHDFANMPASSVTDRLAIEAMGAELAGSDRPFVVTSALALGVVGRPSVETDLAAPGAPVALRQPSELAALAFATQGVRASVMRLPASVHGVGGHGFVAALIGIARQKGLSAYVGDGDNCWPAVHRTDAARAYRLALEKAPAGTRLHAVAEQGVPTREIAAVIGRRLGLPVASKSGPEADEHFGWMRHFFGAEMSADSTATRKLLGWAPTGPTLLEDIDQNYFGG